MPELAGWVALLALCLAFALGGLAQGATGVGFGLVAAPACALLLDPSEVVGTLARLALAVDLVLLVTGRRSIDRRAVGNYLVPALLAAPVGLAILAVASDGAVLVGIAVLTLAGAALLVQPVRAVPLGPGTATQVAAGFLAGVMAVTAAMPGPAVAVDAARRQRSPAETRATLAVFFAVVDLLAAVANPVSVGAPALVLHAVAAGTGLAVAHRAAGRIRDDVARRLLAALIALGAASVLLRQLL